MTDMFTVVCDTDHEFGPELQTTAGGSSLIDPDAWSAFLIEHRHHELSLFHGSAAKPRTAADMSHLVPTMRHGVEKNGGML